MNTLTTEQKIYQVLRFAVVMCFIGHGAFGIITKQIWCNYFAVFGIGQATAYKLMPVVGVMDITMGLSMLIYPTRAVALWLVIWGFITALLRPLSGEPFAEVIERAGNYGAPLAMLLLIGGSATFKGWFKRIDDITHVKEGSLKLTTRCLKLVVLLLLAGHGWLNLIEKKGLMSQYAALGFSNPATVAHLTGIFEIVAAASILIKPIRPIIFALLIWKAGTELFYPHWEAFEWIERGGSYCALLALWLALPKTNFNTQRIFINRTFTNFI